MMSGGNIGTIMGMPAVAWMSDSFGWTTSFYVLAVLGLTWCATWAFYVTDTPRTHKRISKAEIAVIESGTVVNTTGIKPSVRWANVIRTKQVHSSIVVVKIG